MLSTVIQQELATQRIAQMHASAARRSAPHHRPWRFRALRPN